MPATHKNDIVFVPFKHRDESLAMHRTQQGQIFSWRNLDTGTVHHYHIETLLHEIEINPQAFELRYFACQNEVAEQLRTTGGIEMDHVLHLALQASKTELLKPGIMLELPGEPHPTHVNMDGNHRYYVLTKAKRQSMAFWVVGEEQAKFCELDVPEFDCKI